MSFLFLFVIPSFLVILFYVSLPPSMLYFYFYFCCSLFSMHLFVSFDRFLELSSVVIYDFVTNMWQNGGNGGLGRGRERELK